MSLVDRTNETIPLSIEGRVSFYVDADADSSFSPSEWVVIAVDDTWDEPTYRLTYAEAGLLHDRLGLILGRSGTEVGP